MDVVALGELLVDFTSAGISGQGNQIYEANPGGAPCNVLAMLQKLGRNTAFIERLFWRNVGVGSKRTGNFSRGNLL